MALSWDEQKRLETFYNRQLDFSDAEKIFSGFYVEQVDDRKDYGEIRHIVIGMVDEKVLVVVWTSRPDSKRIISMRKANVKEEARYRAALDGYR
jgi:uncharacterized DUF497 family protein